MYRKTHSFALADDLTATFGRSIFAAAMLLGSHSVAAETEIGEQVPKTAQLLTPPVEASEDLFSGGKPGVKICESAQESAMIEKYFIIEPQDPRGDIQLQMRVFVRPGYAGKLVNSIILPWVSSFPGLNWDGNIYSSDEMNVETYGPTGSLTVFDIDQKFECHIWRVDKG